MAENREFSLKLTGDSRGAETAIQRVQQRMQQLQLATDQSSAASQHLTSIMSSQAAAIQRLSASTDKQAAAIKQLNAVTPKQVQVAQQVNQVTAQQAKSAEQATSSLDKLLIKTVAWAAASGTAYIAAKKLTESLLQGDKINQVARAFDQISASAGLLANDRMAGLRTATQGVISDFELMKSANLAAQLDIDVKKFDSLSASAVRLGEAVGRDATSSVNDLVVALGRQSSKILDNLGIMLKQSEANKIWAAQNGRTVDSLTELERKTAFQEVAIQKMAAKVAGLPQVLDDAGRAMSRLSTQFENAGNEFATGTTKSETMRQELDELNKTVDGIDWAKAGEAASEFGGILLSVANGAVSIFISAIQQLRNELADNWLTGGLVSQLERLPGSIKNLRNHGYLGGNERNDIKINRLQSEIAQAQQTASTYDTAGQGFGGMLTNLLGIGSSAPGMSYTQTQAAAARAREAELRKQLAAAYGQDFDGFVKAATPFAMATSIGGLNLMPHFPSGDGEGDGDGGIDKAAKQIEKLRDSLAKLSLEAEKANISEKISKALAVGDTATAGTLGKKFAELTGDGVKQGLLKGAKEGGPEAAKLAAQAAAIEIEKQGAEAYASIQGKLADFKFDNAQNQLEESFEEALKKGNVAAATDIQAKLKQTIYNATLAGQTEAYESGNPAAIKAAEEYAQAVADEYERTAAKKIEEANKEAFQNSVSFFSDLLTSAAESDAATIENTLKNALKRVAIGFASQMAASVAASMGFSGLGNIGSAGGLGQSLAASLGFEGGGVSKITDLFGGGLTASAVLLHGSAAALTSAAAALAASAQIPGAAPGVPEIVGAERLPAGGLETLLTKSGIAAAAIVATAITAKAGYDSFEAGQKGGIGAGLKEGFNDFTDLAAAFASGGLSILTSAGAGIAGGLFGDSKKAAEREAREKILDQLFNGDLGVQTVQGQFNLNPNSVNSDAIGVGPNDIGLANPLAMLASGGDDKMQGDLANIFAEAINQADNFNESIVNTLSLMDKLGYNAEEAKGGLASLFLDGEIALNEFGASLSTLNVLAQEDLTGPNSIMDAFRIMAENIESQPAVALKGLELAFKEMAQAGIDTQSEVIAYATENLGPEMAGVFQTLYESGITSWEAIGNAGPDALFAIFNALDPVKGSLQEFFDILTAGDENTSLDNTAGEVSKVGKVAQNANQELRETLKLTSALSSGGGRGGGGTDPNATTTERRLYRR